MRKRIDTKGNIMLEQEAHDEMIATLEQENRQLHARNQRLQEELDVAYEKCAQVADSYRSIEGRGIAEQIRGFVENPEAEMFVMDHGCFERGCCCYDDRVDTDGVVVRAYEVKYASR